MLIGDPVWLEPANGRRFLTFHTEATMANAGSVVIHDMGVHPDWGLIAPLRQHLRV